MRTKCTDHDQKLPGLLYPKPERFRLYWIMYKFICIFHNEMQSNLILNRMYILKNYRSMRTKRVEENITKQNISTTDDHSSLGRDRRRSISKTKPLPSMLFSSDED